MVSIEPLEILLKLYIAEKPSLGRAIAAALPKPHKSQQGYIELGNGDIVSWCIGHILEQADPEVYNDDFKKWRMEHLPIIPEQWQLTPKAQTRSQLNVLRKLVKNASEIIHAGDPDRVTRISNSVDTINNSLNS
jgi:DNA topoisomerase-3